MAAILLTVDNVDTPAAFLAGNAYSIEDRMEGAGHTVTRILYSDPLPGTIGNYGAVVLGYGSTDTYAHITQGLVAVYTGSAYLSNIHLCDTDAASADNASVLTEQATALTALKGGLSGDVTVFGSAHSLRYGATGWAAGLDDVYTAAGGIQIGGIPTGGTLADDTAANGRRYLFLPCAYNVTYWPDLTEDGWTLFLAGVAWAATPDAAGINQKLLRYINCW